MGRSMAEIFDYVIVGAGTAGCLLAERLTENPATTVCLIEAGPRDLHPFIHLPAGYIKMLFNPAYTWRFTTEPSPGSGGRRIATTQGRMLGGSSSLNGLVYNRGQAADFDSWAQRGNRGWSYDGLHPLFRRAERRAGGDGTFRGGEGALPVTDLDWQHPLCQAFVTGAQHLGIPWNSDYNGAEQTGVGYYQRVIHSGLRQSSARAFLSKAKRRANLRLLTNTQVSRITFDGNRATGVLVLNPDGTDRAITAGREVILAAGAMNSPKLLQISGVGPADLMSDIGVTPVAVLQGVGANRRDH